MMIPRSTVRLQLHKGFNLDDAAQVVGYFESLGLSHLYLSPVFQARPGSTHGYDGLSPNQINPELGGEPALLRLADRARSHGLGLILDIVPNHLAALSPDNPWWTDVLRNGRGSGYAHYFDIDWDRPSIPGLVLIPILSRPYSQALAEGEIRLVHQTEGDQFAIACSEALLPLSPESQSALRAEQALGRRSVAELLSVYNDAEIGRRRLHDLLELQHYRLAWWQTAADDINWRRFFEITELVGVRVEQPEVFEAVHTLLFRLYREGRIDGVRVDHVDGLADPAGYCRKLALRLDQLSHERPPEALLRRPYLIVEKILEDREPLRTDWKIDGTTGYEFMNDMSAVLHDASGEKPLTALWNEIAPGVSDLEALLRTARRKMISENFASEFDSLCRLWKELADTEIWSRDYSLAMIRRALAAWLEQFRVYRTYIQVEKQSSSIPAGKAQSRLDEKDEKDLDEFYLHKALEKARPDLRPADHPALDWLGGCFGAERSSDFPGYDHLRSLVLLAEAVTRFQQLTSPLAAKSLEDTVFYQYGRMLSRNEVGSDPGRFSLSADEFHSRLKRWSLTFPNRMLATATHDHKRGEDARARLAVLSEAPEEWSGRVRRWLEHFPGPNPEIPDPAERCLLFQTLTGVWPNSPVSAEGKAARAEGGETLDTLEQRVARWLTKALREAKRHTSWTAVNQEYEEACRAYLRALFAGLAAENSVLGGIIDFAALISPAGALNSLGQVLVRLAAPGVPDLYQGTEKWDLSLVDPDNRRPVDFDDLRASLTDEPDWPELMTAWRDGRLKQALIRQTLHFRRQHPEIFEKGDYLPLKLTGRHGERGLAFLRRYRGKSVLAAVSRLAFPLLMEAGADWPLVPPAYWEDTAIQAPPGFENGWFNVLTGETGSGHGSLPLAELFENLPISLLIPVP